ncbi:VaFE repeat-containing surface-anchored protein [Corynebacterium amycolatum]|uniref:VaFE repeat-containing surface-anchored protein n=1 Tax=Corynebacterium amycolatum TaxID=43765 RepID=A0AB37GK33_CORAY|nr:VaFE repeat-containing surface-anchored protein [Corynebacterium amycolatum]QPR31533.1 VaFE repeat-containing surface-anchored protein [Corynebacterium amycolatum]QQB83414.1 VaFE repeat-containing surface-anchored protein [Corynebacterium amycolatum]
MFGRFTNEKRWLALFSFMAVLALFFAKSPIIAHAQDAEDTGETLTIQKILSVPGTVKGVEANGNVRDFGPLIAAFDEAATPFGSHKMGYCIEASVAGDLYDTGRVQNFSQFSRSTDTNNKLRNDFDRYRKLNWIAHHGSPAVGLDELGKAAGVKGRLNVLDANNATQFALWHFSDDIDFSKGIHNPSTKAVYDYLTGPANVGQGTVDGTNRTGYIFNNGKKQDIIVIDNVTPSSGEVPAEPTKPSEPEKPTEPEQPTEPEKPTTPTTPTETTTPSESTKPSEPEKPTTLKPSISTQARLNGNKIVAGAVVKDIVKFTDLVPGKNYRLDATLVDKTNADRILGTGSVEFTPETSSGEQTVMITVSDDVDEPVSAAVAFEKLTSTEVTADGQDNADGQPVEITSHEDINDAAQTVHGEKPEQPTTSEETPTSEETTEETTEPSSSETATSETSESEAPTTSESEEQPSSSTTTPNASESTKPAAPTEPTEPTDSTESQTTEPTEPTETTEPSKPSEPADTPLEPELRTVAELQGNRIEANAKVVDTVHFEGLVPGKNYTLSGELVNKADGSVIGHGEATFKPTSASGTVTVTLEVSDSVKSPVAEAVVFEHLTSDEVDSTGKESAGQVNEIADHADINDANQTVTGEVPEKPEDTPTEESETPSEETTAPETSSTEPTTSTVPVTPSEDEPSEQPETTQPEEPSETTTPSKSESEKPSKPSKPSKPAQPEKPSKPNHPSAPAQSEDNPAITTTAGIAGKGLVEKGAVVIDTVRFTGLKPGTKYTLIGELMCKETGKSTGARSRLHFVPTASAGTVDVPIIITDADCGSQVAFETLTDAKGKEVAVHKDINSAEQTVTNGKTPENTPSEQPRDEGEQNTPNDDSSAPTSDSATPNTVINQHSEQNNTNVTIIGGTGQDKQKNHGKPLAPNSERRAISSVPSGPTGLATHALPTVATN